MKKNYQKPNTDIVMVELQKMIALSGNMDNNQEITDSNGFAAREYDDWDW